MVFTPLRFPRLRGTETFFSIKEVIFSKTYPSFLTLKEGSTSHPCPLSSGAREETALLGAWDRYALRLADHQRSAPYYAGWDRLIMGLYHKSMLLYHFSDKTILSQANSLI